MRVRVKPSLVVECSNFVIRKPFERNGLEMDICRDNGYIVEIIPLYAEYGNEDTIGVLKDTDKSQINAINKRLVETGYIDLCEYKNFVSLYV